DDGPEGAVAPGSDDELDGAGAGVQLFEDVAALPQPVDHAGERRADLFRPGQADRHAADLRLVLQPAGLEHVRTGHLPGRGVHVLEGPDLDGAGVAEARARQQVAAREVRERLARRGGGGDGLPDVPRYGTYEIDRQPERPGHRVDGEEGWDGAGAQLPHHLGVVAHAVHDHRAAVFGD